MGAKNSSSGRRVPLKDNSMEPPRYTEAQQFGRLTAEYDRHERTLWLVWADTQLVLNSQEAAGLLTYLYNLRYQIFNRQQQEPRLSEQEVRQGFAQNGPFNIA